MKRLMDISVAVLLIVIVVVTVRSFTQKEESTVSAPREAQPTPSPTPSPPPDESSRKQRAEQARLEELESRNRQMEEQNARLRAEANQLRLENELRKGNELGDFDGRLGVEPRDPFGEGERASGSRGVRESEPISEVDARRAEARRKLAEIFRRLGPAGRTLIRAAKIHVQSCGNVTEGQCRVSLENLGRQAIAVGTTLRDAQELARTSWLAPGDIRELRRTHGIDDRVFDEIVRIVSRYSR